MQILVQRHNFFEKEQAETVTVNGDRYRTMLNEFLFTKIEEEDICNTWFQRDGVWPPRSSDLTPLDYYLWDAVKDKCYADKLETIDALKDNICETIGEIQLHTIDNVLKNWTALVGNYMASRGSHLNEIIFHY